MNAPQVTTVGCASQTQRKAALRQLSSSWSPCGKVRLSGRAPHVQPSAAHCEHYGRSSTHTSMPQFTVLCSPLESQCQQHQAGQEPEAATTTTTPQHHQHCHHDPIRPAVARSGRTQARRAQRRAPATRPSPSQALKHLLDLALARLLLLLLLALLVPLLLLPAVYRGLGLLERAAATPGTRGREACVPAFRHQGRGRPAAASAAKQTYPASPARQRCMALPGIQPPCEAHLNIWYRERAAAAATTAKPTAVIAASDPLLEAA